MNNKSITDKFEKFAEGKEIESQEDFRRVFDEFMKIQKIVPFNNASEKEAEDAYDYLELSDAAPNKKQALKYAKKALELEPDNIDAQIAIADLTANTAESLLEKYKALIKKADIKMKADGWFSEEYIGEFWGYHETRPYMRLRAEYLDSLINCSMFGLAIKECNDLLRLCENDNLGIRYRLMHLLAFFEDEKSALELLDKYDEKSTMFLLPMSVLYYKLGNLTKATKYLRELQKVNKDTEIFFSAFIEQDFEEYYDEMSGIGYRPFTIEEFLIEMQENGYLFASTPQYVLWASRKLKL